ncbi:Aminopeptidase 2 [Venturia nashicola]|uniref:Aminopeptidase 2 n=1 Tax=Venturia nashicola TaxID=86259 RepID=A0A4Z1PT31_9PEZI|nr:Aminopeptidase 2 [Venturia nashicola]
MSAMKFSKPGFKPIIDNTREESKPQDFNPTEHLTFTPPEQVIMMTDLGYPADMGVSPVAVSQPFKLFSDEAVQQMRSEILHPEVMKHCGYQSNIAASQLRGYAPKYAPFTYDAWKHPETLAIISKIAGVDLVPEMDFEIGHINFSVKSEKDTQREREEIESQRRLFEEDEGIAGCPWEDDKPVVGWHTDSYPFVCVLMLSDCTDMVGGETALCTGNGDILKVRGPQMGCAVVLQGRYINHQALRALGAQERITSVTSFRPKCPHMRDDTVLTSVRPVSDLSLLYGQFAEYRLEMLEERVRAQLKKVRENRFSGKKFDSKTVKAFLQEQQDFLAHTNREIVPEDQVVAGHIEEVVFPKLKDSAVCVEEEAGPPSKRARFD